MEALKTMPKMEDLKTLVDKYGQVKECTCGHWAIPSTDTFEEKYNDNVTLVLNNFPVFKCIECNEITYSPSDYLDLYDLAEKYYLRTNEKVFDCGSPPVK